VSEIQYEKRDIDAGKIVWLGIGLVVVTALVAVASLWILRGLAGREIKGDPPPAPLAQHDRPLPNPFLEAQAPPTGDTGTPVLSPPQHLKQYRLREQQVLTSYGWVDRNAAIAHIPVARALDLVLAGGLAAAPAPPTGAASPQPAAAKGRR